MSWVSLRAWAGWELGSNNRPLLLCNRGTDTGISVVIYPVRST